MLNLEKSKKAKWKIYLKISVILMSGYIILYFAYLRVKGDANYPDANRIGDKVFQPLQYFLNSDLSKENTEKSGKLTVTGFKIKTHNLSPSINSPGVIDFKDKVDVYSKLSGRIEKIYVTEGEKVEKGQKLFKIESLQYELELMKQEATMESSKAQVQLAEEKYAKAKLVVEAKIKEQEKSRSILNRAKEEFEKGKKTFERKEAVYKDGGLSREEIEVAKLELLRLESTVEIAKKELEIRSQGLTDEDIQKETRKIPETDKERIKVLKEINSKIEKAELAVAEGVYRSHLAQVNATKILLKEVMNYSPMAGIIAKKYKSDGEMINGSTAGNQSVLSVINIREVFAVFNVAESDGIKLKEGMPVEFSADVYKNEKFIGKINLISPLIDQKSHTTEIKATVKNSDFKLKPGMFIRANIITGPSVPTILIPISSTIPKEEDRATVFIISDGICHKREIRTGRKYDDLIEVVSGLEAVDSIALDRLTNLRDNMPVLPIYPEKEKKN